MFADRRRPQNQGGSFFGYKSKGGPNRSQTFLKRYDPCPIRHLGEGELHPARRVMTGQKGMGQRRFRVGGLPLIPSQISQFAHPVPTELERPPKARHVNFASISLLSAYYWVERQGPHLCTPRPYPSSKPETLAARPSLQTAGALRTPS